MEYIRSLADYDRRLILGWVPKDSGSRKIPDVSQFERSLRRQLGRGGKH